MKKKAKKGKKRYWMQEAAERMKAKGTIGSFGKATPKKIAAAKRKGGKMKKKAIFAQNAAKAAKRRKKRGTKR